MVRKLVRNSINTSCPYFLRKSRLGNSLEPVQIFRGQEVDKLSEIVISREVVSKEIDRLKKTKSPGPDDIFPRILRECREELVEPIVIIFRKSPDTGAVPRLWRQATVVPIFKKGDKAESSNCRPINLTSVVGKMLEAIIASAIIILL